MCLTQGIRTFFCLQGKISGKIKQIRVFIFKKGFHGVWEPH
jgi:hypothetical protein